MFWKRELEQTARAVRPRGGGPGAHGPASQSSALHGIRGSGKHGKHSLCRCLPHPSLATSPPPAFPSSLPSGSRCLRPVAGGDWPQFPRGRKMAAEQQECWDGDGSVPSGRALAASLWALSGAEHSSPGAPPGPRAGLCCWHTDTSACVTPAVRMACVVSCLCFLWAIFGDRQGHEPLEHLRCQS